jgi:hypothetical protein
MRYVSFVVAIATLAVVGCADQYYPGSGYAQQGYPGSGYSQQGYAYPSSYPANYGSYPGGSGTYPSRYGYGSTGGYSNYGGGGSGPGITIRLP